MRRARGISLIELTGVVAISMLVFTAASKLLLEGLRVVDRTRRADFSVDLNSTVVRLRRDIEEAGSVSGGLSVSAVAGGYGAWTSVPLILVRSGSGTVRWELRGKLLTRIETDEMGRGVRRTVAAGVSSWQWRLVTERLVTVQLTAPPVPKLTVSRKRPEERRTVVWSALRGGERGRAW